MSLEDLSGKNTTFFVYWYKWVRLDPTSAVDLPFLGAEVAEGRASASERSAYQ